MKLWIKDAHNICIFKMAAPVQPFSYKPIVNDIGTVEQQ